MEIDKLKKLLTRFGSNVIFNQNLKKKNWFNIGGEAKVFFKANNLKDLVDFLKTINNQEKISIIGAGSNILITDDLFDGAIIKLGQNFNNISLMKEDIIISGTAVLDKKLSDFAAENNLSGFEFLSCIPGSIGGGIKMNAGCFENEFKDILISVQAIDLSGKVFTIPAKEINFEYRNNDLPENLIFLSASFKGTKDTSKNITDKMNELKFDGLYEKLENSEITEINPLKMSVTDIHGSQFTEIAINEVALSRTTHQAAKLQISINNTVRLNELISDGLLISTPAGSTAYNLSADGPILPISAKLMALTPTSPFRPRRWKGALIDINSDVEIEVLDPEYRKVNATADSHEIKNAKNIIISNDTSIKLRIMFDLNYNLEERIIREQFMS